VPDSGPAIVPASGAENWNDEREHAHMDRIQKIFPKGPNPSNWILALRVARRIVEQGKATWEELVAAVERYAKFVAAGGVSEPRYVRAAHNFFDIDAGLWSQPWDPPASKADARLDNNIAAAAEAKRRLFGDTP
jgi:hypothetical protein